VFQIREILAQIQIIRSVPKKQIRIHTNISGLYLSFGGIEMQENSKMYLTLGKILFGQKNFAIFCEIS
jgi:hypothetical protein